MRDIELIEKNKIESVTPLEKNCMESLDSIAYSICKRRLEIIGEEAKEVIMRTSVSPLVRAGDVNAAIYTASGDVAISSCGAYAHAFLGELPIKYILKHYKDDESIGIHEGDIFFTNEALYGGVHNPDMMIFVPIFYDDRLISWAAAVAHEGECGAKDPGGFSPKAASRYEEGMHVSPIKLGENFKLKKDLITMLENFVRTPRQLTMDLRSQIAACYRIRTRMSGIIEESGSEIVIGTLKKIIEDNRKVALNRIRDFNDGTYRHVCFLDSVGLDKGLVKVSLSLTKSGDRVLFDFSECSPQMPGPYNSTVHGSKSFVGTWLAGFVFSNMTINAGILDPFEYRFVKGSVIDCEEDAACSLLNFSVYMVDNAVGQCFGRMMFDSSDRETVSADWFAGLSGIFYGGRNQRGIPIVGFPSDVNSGGGCASNYGDGVSMSSPIWALMADNGDLEHEELEYPVMHLYRKFAINRHGYGKHRGGSGCDIAYMVHNTEGIYVGSFGLGNKFPISQGIFGGYADGCFPGIRLTKSNLLELMKASSADIPYSTNELVGEKKVKGDYEISPLCRDLAYLAEGEVITMGTGGGGGYGDVLERDSDAVIKDLAQKLITDWVAKNIYFVSYDSATLIVDYEKTKKMRHAERENRKKRGVPYDKFEKQWLSRKPPEDALKYYGPWPKGQK